MQIWPINIDILKKLIALWTKQIFKNMSFKQEQVGQTTHTQTHWSSTTKGKFMVKRVMPWLGHLIWLAYYRIMTWKNPNQPNLLSRCSYQSFLGQDKSKNLKVICRMYFKTEINCCEAPAYNLKVRIAILGKWLGLVTLNSGPNCLLFTFTESQSFW